MDKRVLTEVGQGINDTDFERLGTFPQDGIDRLTRDLINSGIAYSGFNTVKASNDSVTLQIAAGTVYKGGRQYVSGNSEVRTIADILPTLAGKSVIALVVAQCVEVNENLENRYYERPIDASNPNSAVARTVDDAYRVKARNAVLTIVAGTEANRPAAPSAPGDAVAIAEVLITTSGIQKVTMREDTRVVRLAAVVAEQNSLRDYLDDIKDSVEGLRVALAAVSASGAAATALQAIAAIESDLALIKEANNFPVDGAPYYADNFLDYGASDYNPENQTGNLDFNARVDEGIRFAYEAESLVQLSVLNPNDPNLALVSKGLICPAYNEVDGLAVKKATGDMPLGGVAVQTVVAKTLTKSRTRVRYGKSFVVSTSSKYWRDGVHDNVRALFRDAGGTLYSKQAVLSTLPNSVGMVRLRELFYDKIEVNYERFTVKEKTISGVVKAETFVQSVDRWVTGTDLGIKRWGAGAEITAVLCECDNLGHPDSSRVLASVNLKEASFKAWPNWTPFNFDEPVLTGPLSTDDGKTRAYAVVWYTIGDVDVMTADGTAFTGGTLLSTTDMVYYDADITKDICFKLRYAKFQQTNFPVRLGPWQLNGGIENIDVLASILEPNSCRATFQVLVGSKWRSLDETEAGASFLAGTQGIYDVRVMLTGTAYSMPIIDTYESRVRCSRPKAHGDWIGAAWAIGSAATQIKIKAVVGAYDATYHNLTAAIRYGAGYATVKQATGNPVVRVVPGRSVDKPSLPNAVTMEWTFDFASAINQCKPEIIFDTTQYKIPLHIEQIVVRKSA